VTFLQSRNFQISEVSAMQEPLNHAAINNRLLTGPPSTVSSRHGCRYSAGAFPDKSLLEEGRINRIGASATPLPLFDFAPGPLPRNF